MLAPQDAFASAAAQYDAGQFSEAGNGFTHLFREKRRCSIAVNAVAALVKAGELKRAKRSSQWIG